MSFESSQEESLLASGGCQQSFRGFLVSQLVKNPPAMQKTLVRFLGWEDPLEKRWATHSSILGFPGGSNGKRSA